MTTQATLYRPIDDAYAITYEDDTTSLDVEMPTNIRLKKKRVDKVQEWATTIKSGRGLKEVF